MLCMLCRNVIPTFKFNQNKLTTVKREMHIITKAYMVELISRVIKIYFWVELMGKIHQCVHQNYVSICPRFI